MTDITFVTSEAIQLREYETVIERGLSTFMDVGEALLAIRDKRLYRNTHSTFEDYCQHRWGFTRQHGNRLISAFETAKRLEPIGSIPASESHIRPLTQLDPDEQDEVWQRANETAPEGNITARHVQEVVDRHIEAKTGGNGAARPESSEDYQASNNAEQLVDEDTGEIISSGNGRHKPKVNRAGDEYALEPSDLCQTPPYAIEPLTPYLFYDWTIWEPACGDGLLVDALRNGKHRYSERQLIAGDIQSGQNFFDYEPDSWDCLVTNPPYSIKYRFLERCYQLGKPFALLVPVETLGAKQAQALFKEYGLEIMLLDQRVDFKMPRAGWGGSSSQFPVMWLCWHILPEPIMFGSIETAKRAFVDSLELA